MKQIKGPDGAALNKASGMLWAGDCCSSPRCWATQPARAIAPRATSTQENDAFLFQNNWVFSTYNTNQLFLNINLSGASTPWVKSSIGALWDGDQFHYWVKRFININHGTFAYVTHRHNLPSENREQNPYNSSVCRFLIARYKLTMEVTWARRVYQAKSQTTKVHC